MRYTTMTHVRNQRRARSRPGHGPGARPVAGERAEQRTGVVAGRATACGADRQPFALRHHGRERGWLVAAPLSGADASGRLVWNVPGRLVWEKPWSPDGRFLAFRANRATDGQKVGWSPDDQCQLALLDVNSGQTRVLTTSSAHIGRFVWRSDGNAIRAIKRTVVRDRGRRPDRASSRSR